MQITTFNEQKNTQRREGLLEKWPTSLFNFIEQTILPQSRALSMIPAIFIYLISYFAFIELILIKPIQPYCIQFAKLPSLPLTVTMMSFTGHNKQVSFSRRIENRFSALFDIYLYCAIHFE